MAKMRPGGRPTAGLRAGESVVDYAGHSLRLPLPSKLALQATATVTRVPIWRLVTDMIAAHIEGLPAPQRRQIADLAESWAKAVEKP